MKIAGGILLSFGAKPLVVKRKKSVVYILVFARGRRDILEDKKSIDDDVFKSRIVVYRAKRVTAGGSGRISIIWDGKITRCPRNVPFCDSAIHERMESQHGLSIYG